MIWSMDLSIRNIYIWQEAWIFFLVHGKKISGRKCFTVLPRSTIYPMALCWMEEKQKVLKNSYRMYCGLTWWTAFCSIKFISGISQQLIHISVYYLWHLRWNIWNETGNKQMKQWFRGGIIYNLHESVQDRADHKALMGNLIHEQF